MKTAKQLNGNKFKFSKWQQIWFKMIIPNSFMCGGLWLDVYGNTYRTLWYKLTNGKHTRTTDEEKNHLRSKCEEEEKKNKIFSSYWNKFGPL